MPTEPNVTLRTGLLHPDLESRLMADLVALKRGDPFAPVVLLVGSHLAAEYIGWRLLKELPGWTNIHILTFSRLAGALKAAATPLPPLPHGGETAAAAAALGNLPADHYFAGVADRPGLLRALTATLKDLEEAGLERYPLKVSPAAEGYAKVKTLTALWDNYRRALDPFETLARAFTPPEDSAAAFQRAFGCDRLVIYGIYDFTALQLNLVDSLLPGIALDVYLPFLPAAGDGGAFDYARPAYDHFRALAGGEVAATGAGTAGLSAALFNYRLHPPPRPDPATAKRVRICSGRDPDDEVAGLVGRINELVTWEDVSPADIGVILWNAADYRDRVGAALERAGIPWFDAVGAPLSDLPESRALRALLELDPMRLNRRRLCDILAQYPLRLDPGDDPVEWEAASVRAGLVEADSQRWDAALTALEREPDDRSDPRRNRLREQLGRFRGFVRELADCLQPFSSEGTWQGCLAACRKLLEQFIPSGECRRTLGEVFTAMEPAAAILPRVGRERFLQVLDAALTAKSTIKGRLRTDGVTVCDKMTARGLRFRYLFIPGMVQGAVPVKSREDPILPDGERRAINRALSATEHSPLSLKGERLAEERLLFTLAVEAAGERLCPSWHQYGDDGKPKLPSRFLMELCRVLTGEAVNLERLQDLDFTEDAHDPDLLRRRAWREDELVLETLRARFTGRRLKNAVGKAFAGRNPLFDRALAAARARSDRSRLTPWDGIISAAQPPESHGVTGLEKWCECPFRHLLSRVLGLDVWREPELAVELPPHAVGSLVHNVLAGLVKSAIGAGKETFSPADEPWAMEKAAGILSIHLKRFRQDFPLPRAVWNAEERMLRQRLGNFVKHLCSDSTGVRFKGVEEKVTGELHLDSESSPLRLKLHGRIDRVDESSDGIRLVDYKTGKVDKHPENLNGGTKLQQYLYLRLKGAERFDYFYIGGDGSLGVYGITNDDYRERVADISVVLRAATTGIAAGFFPPSPREKKTCERCDYSQACDLHSRLSSREELPQEELPQLLRSAGAVL